MSFSYEIKDKVSAPPGFVSRTSFRVQIIKRNEEDSGTAGFAGEVRSSQKGASSDGFDIAELRNTFEHKPWIFYNQGNRREVESNGENCKIPISQPSLLRGVTAGCHDYSKCQKARWRPEDACMTPLEEAPVFYPTKEDFEDIPKYIATIRPNAEGSGICRIVPPHSWVPSGHVPEEDVSESYTFTTLIQNISELGVDFSVSKTEDSNKITGRKRKIVGYGYDNVETGALDEPKYKKERLGFENGPEMSLKAFKKYADDFRLQYFDLEDDLSTSSTASKKCCKVTDENIEGEYWRIVENPTEALEVLAVANLDSRPLGIGFSKASKVHDANGSMLLKSGWNLQNSSNLPDSLLTYETNDSSGVLHSRLFFGMCFSSHCWKVEDSLLYSLYYMHTGAPKMWYGIPGKYFLKFQAIVEKYYPHMVSKQPETLYKLVRQLPPFKLKSEGIPVYRCIQHPKEFVLIFPAAYHAAFDCGFNCVELGNYASIDWLPYGQMAMELYSGLAIRTSISTDKLMLKAASEGVRALWRLSLLHKNETDPNLTRWKSFTGKDAILVKALRRRISWLETRRKYLCGFLQTKKMDSDYDTQAKMECCICHYDLHLSAISCSCSRDRFTCLNHAKQHCVCPWSSKVLLHRYEISQLKLLVEALEGKLSAVYKWAKEMLGLLLHSNVDGLVPTQQSAPEKSMEVIKNGRIIQDKVADCLKLSAATLEKYKSQRNFFPST